MKEIKDLLNRFSDAWFFWPVVVIAFFTGGFAPVSVFLVLWKLFVRPKEDDEEDWTPSLTPTRETVDTRINKPKQTARAQSAPNAAASAGEPPVRKKRRPKKPKSFGLSVWGGVLASLGLFMTSFSVPELIRGSGDGLEDILMTIAFLVIGVSMLVRGQMNARAAKRYDAYVPMIGERQAVSVEELGAMAGQPRERVLKDLSEMISAGYFEDTAYLNRELGYLFRTNAADQAWREKQRSAGAAAPKEAEKGYSGILRNIRRANDEIADPVLSEKIERLENITARIFRAVEDDPKKAERIETFLTYYLPTTQKLLDSYAQFEAAGVEGENLSQAKERISSTMDMIIDGFSHQLDALYKADALDVDSDIRVMETMLRRDVGTVADDFGFTPSGKPAPKEPASGTTADKKAAADTHTNGSKPGVWEEDPFGLWGGGAAAQKQPEDTES